MAVDGSCILYSGASVEHQWSLWSISGVSNHIQRGLFSPHRAPLHFSPPAGCLALDDLNYANLSPRSLKRLNTTNDFFKVIKLDQLTN